MNSFVRRTLNTGAALVLAGTIGTAVSHVFGQTFDDANGVPPSPTYGFSSTIPPAPSTPISAKVGKPAPSVASPPKPAAVTTPPYAYSRTRNQQVRQQPAKISNPPPSSAVRTVSAESTSTDKSSSAVQHADASSWTGLAPKPANASSTSQKGVSQTSHFNSLYDPNQEPSLGPPPDGAGRLFNRVTPPQPPAPNATSTFPTDRATPPAFRGSHLGLLPGETATERSMRLMQAVADMERQVEALSQRNIELSETIRQRDEQLAQAARDVRFVRNDVNLAKDELQRLREQVRNLQEKVIATERDNTALLQTMAPLLYQMLGPDAASSSKVEE